VHTLIVGLVLHDHIVLLDSTARDTLRPAAAIDECKRNLCFAVIAGIGSSLLSFPQKPRGFLGIVFIVRDWLCRVWLL
jgi:hypothetical protein